MFCTTIGHTPGITLFVDHFIEDLGLTRVKMSLIWDLSLFLSGFGLPFAGAFIDNYGGRLLVQLIIVPYVIVIFCMSFI